MEVWLSWTSANKLGFLDIANRSRGTVLVLMELRRAAVARPTTFSSSCSRREIPLDIHTAPQLRPHARSGIESGLAKVRTTLEITHNAHVHPAIRGIQRRRCLRRSCAAYRYELRSWFMASSAERECSAKRCSESGCVCQAPLIARLELTRIPEPSDLAPATAVEPSPP